MLRGIFLLALSQFLLVEISYNLRIDFREDEHALAGEKLSLWAGRLVQGVFFVENFAEGALMR